MFFHKILLPASGYGLVLPVSSTHGIARHNPAILSEIPIPCFLNYDFRQNKSELFIWVLVIMLACDGAVADITATKSMIPVNLIGQLIGLFLRLADCFP